MFVSVAGVLAERVDGLRALASGVLVPRRRTWFLLSLKLSSMPESLACSTTREGSSVDGRNKHVAPIELVPPNGAGLKPNARSTANGYEFSIIRATRRGS